MKLVPEREGLRKEKNSLLANGFTLFIFFTISSNPLLLTSSFSRVIKCHSFLLSLPALHLPLLTATFFSPPLFVIGKGWCTRIHLIKCTHTITHTRKCAVRAHTLTHKHTHTHTILTDFVFYPVVK